MSWRCAARTHPGLTKDINQDSYALHPERGLFLLSDGMGGMNAGQVASRMTIEGLEQRLVHDADPITETRLRRAIFETSYCIWETGVSSRGMFAMGATLVVAWFTPQGVCLAHAGDSRAYVHRQGKLHRLTEDHKVPHGNQMARCMGLRDLEPEIRTFPVNAADCFLLCSDGLTNELDDPTLDTLMSSELAPADLCGLLVKQANAHGGRDNITVIVVKMLPPAATSAA